MLRRGHIINKSHCVLKIILGYVRKPYSGKNSAILLRFNEGKDYVTIKYNTGKLGNPYKCYSERHSVSVCLSFSFALLHVHGWIDPYKDWQRNSMHYEEEHLWYLFLFQRNSGHS